VPVYPGYVCAIVGALKIGRPVKWIETRTENLTSTGFARDYHMDVEIGATADGRSRRCTCDDRRSRRVSTPRPILEISRRHLRHRHRQLRLPGRPRRGRRVLHEQGAGGIALSLLVPRHRSQLRDRARHGHPRRRARAWTRWSCGKKNFIRKDQFPYPSALGFTYDSGDYHQTLDVALEKIGYTRC
jgi:carbon-monoxide dehydrogenase large subunit